MATPEGKVPIFESVFAAIRLWREALPRVWPFAVGGALILGLLSFASQRAGGNMAVSFLLDLTAFIVISGIYAAQMHGPLGIAPDWRRRGADALRVFASMSVIAFFLFILFIVALIPGLVVLGVAFGPAGVAEVEAAQADPARAIEVAARLTQENWPIMTLLAVLYTAIWMALTSRFYLAAPASVADERPRTFETWPWTKGSMWRIAAARIALLGPVWLALNAIQAGVVMAFGLNPFDPSAFRELITNRPLNYFAMLVPMNALTLAALNGLEASLSAYLYKGLKPPASQKT